MAKQAFKTTLKHLLLVAALAAGLSIAAFNRSAEGLIGVDAGYPRPSSETRVDARLRQGDLPTDNEASARPRCVNFAIGGVTPSFGFPVDVAFCMKSGPGGRNRASRR